MYICLSKVRRPNNRFKFWSHSCFLAIEYVKTLRNTSGACKAEFDKIVRSILAEGRELVSYIKQDVSYLGGPTDS